MELIYTDVVDGPDNMLRIMQRIGKKAPLHSTGIGKLLLLNYSNRQLSELIATKGLTAPDAQHSGFTGGAGGASGADSRPRLRAGRRGM